MGIEVKKFSGEGYFPLISYNGWRVAIANFCERLREENLCKVERHTKTDEVFILLQGEAVLHIGMELNRIPMESGKLYNVTCGQWHAISMTPDTKVAIVENDDTGKDNTEYYYFKSKKNSGESNV
ncbi:MAG: cupin domain-containing protein [Clostridia bacterium]|nr:cupin domain-containing protein [Clostridia bacterium]